MTAWLFCTSGSAIDEAGVHANSTLIASGSYLLRRYNKAEGRISAETHTDWVSTYSGLDNNIKNILDNVCSKIIGMMIVKDDPTGYLTREADTNLNVLDEEISKGLNMLNNKTYHTLQTP